MTDPSTWHVYLVTDRSFSLGRSTLEVVEAAVSGGVSAVQLREKDLCTRDFYREGVQLREFLRSHRVPLIINDRIDIALALDADGVHMGQEDMPLSRARQILGPDRIIGISINELDQITDESVELADYLAISPVFSTPTKPDATAPWGLEGVKKVRSLTNLPLVAIGSIKLQNAREVVLAGSDCIAVVTAITAAPDIAGATRQLVDEVRQAKSIRQNDTAKQ
ncbi:thiamine phosphate synthase [Desulfomonile tiedjei]|uniref:Thiamine-phosphate synthase n=1 Tax=Desulfomonile tiedjei (strain ATCC 49306 / DSM 6799 / DCB-1) TaxID=706587 RepID=I4C9U3_DESTA|nr:thiamine phosphate synthase [Desulfomonile tiedjei]AFM26334.1 thiamine-phosphate diphosphorylase [Desulfomonile tiedjei DSM 6799]